MAGITIKQARTALDNWVSADAAVASGQSYSIGGRALTRADAGMITEKIKFWNALVVRMSQGGIRIGGVIPIDG